MLLRLLIADAGLVRALKVIVAHYLWRWKSAVWSTILVCKGARR